MGNHGGRPGKNCVALDFDTGTRCRRDADSGKLVCYRHIPTVKYDWSVEGDRKPVLAEDVDFHGRPIFRFDRKVPNRHGERVTRQTMYLPREPGPQVPEDDTVKFLREIGERFG